MAPKAILLDLDSFHDVCLEVLGKSFDKNDLYKKFEKLPIRIKEIAYQWGGCDTVFGDEAYSYIEANKEIFV